MNKIERASDKLMIAIIVLLIISTIIEVGFLVVYGTACFTKNQCVPPYFFGFGRYMAFPILQFEAYSTMSSQECIINGKEVNCSAFAEGGFQK